MGKDRIRPYLKFLFMFIGMHTVAGQGLVDGFMRGKGNVTTALGYTFESYDTYFVGGRKTQNENLGSIKTNSLGFFAAGGITDYLDLIVSLPYIEARATQGFWSDQSDVQDLSLFLRGRLLNIDISGKDNFSLLGAVGFITPLSDYIADAPVSIGSQSTQWEGRLLAHYRLMHGIFITGQMGYAKRGNVTIDRGFETSVPDAWDYVVRAGGNIKKLYGDLWLQHQNSRSGTDIGPGVPFPSNEIDFTRLGFTLYHPVPKLENFGIAVSTGFTLSGKNIGRSNRISLALVYNFQLLKTLEE